MSKPFLPKPSASARASAKQTAQDADPARKNRELFSLMLADLERSGLTAEDAKLMRLQPQARGENPAVAPPGAGYVIPYFTVEGRPRTDLFRYRYLEDTRKKGFGALGNAKARRYTQPSGTPPGVYWPPFAEWPRMVQDPGVPLIITEGEKKAAVSSKMGAPCIGLGGVWSFRSKALATRLLPELAEVDWKGRKVYIVYDSDAARNSQVCAAESALAEELLRNGAVVFIVRLPDGPGGVKVGLDDYLVAHGAAELVDLCDRTEEYSTSAALHELNAEVVYVKDPGLVLVRESLQPLRAGDFVAHRFADRQYTRMALGAKGEPKMEVRQTAADWIKWPHRAAVKSIVFAPGEDEVTPDGRFNTWRGWPYAPKKGSVALWSELLDFLCDGSDIARTYAEKWFAYPIQNPGVKMRNAVVFWGLGKGTGKSQLGYTIGDLYGDAFWEIDNSHIEGAVAFNEWARNRQFVMGDEISGSSARKVADRLKHMITREKVEVNIKNVPQYSVADCINYYFTAQHPDCFYLEEGDRRFFIHEVKHFRPLDDAFYQAYDAWRRSDAGRSALMHHLMFEVDTGDFNPMAAPPLTDDKKAMIDATRSELDAWVRDMRDFPDVICKKFGNCDIVSVHELVALFEGEGHPKVSPVLMGRKLKIAGVPALTPSDLTTPQVLVQGRLTRLYALRNSKKWGAVKSDKLREEFLRCRGGGKVVKF